MTDPKKISISVYPENGSKKNQIRIVPARTFMMSDAGVDGFSMDPDENSSGFMYDFAMPQAYGITSKQVADRQKTTPIINNETTTAPSKTTSVPTSNSTVKTSPVKRVGEKYVYKDNSRYKDYTADQWYNMTDDQIRQLDRDDIAAFQKFLTTQGYTMGTYGIDGRFGSVTAGDAAKWRDKYATQKALQQAVEEPIVESTPKEASTPVVKATSVSLQDFSDVSNPNFDEEDTDEVRDVPMYKDYKPAPLSIADRRREIAALRRVRRDDRAAKRQAWLNEHTVQRDPDYYKTHRL